MRISDEWMNQAATVTAVLGLVLLSAVIWGRHYQAPWNVAAPAEVAMVRGQQVARPAAEPSPIRPNLAADVGKTDTKTVTAPPAGVETGMDRDHTPTASRSEVSVPVSSAKSEKYSDVAPDAGVSTDRAVVQAGAERREPSWLSLLPN